MALAGGLGSALYITAGILLFPRLGALVAVGLFIAGQMLASLALDGFGWLGVEQDVADVAALIGAPAVGGGVWLIVRAQAGAGAIERRPAARRLARLGLAAGAVLPIRGRSTQQLNAELDAAIAVGAVSSSWPPRRWRSRSPASSRAARRARESSHCAACRGGAGSAGSAARPTSTAVFTLIPDIGADPVVVLTVAGQQLASVAVDRYGFCACRAAQSPAGGSRRRPALRCRADHPSAESPSAPQRAVLRADDGSAPTRTRTVIATADPPKLGPAAGDERAPEPLRASAGDGREHGEAERAAHLIRRVEQAGGEP